MKRNEFEAMFLKLVSQFGNKTYSQDRVNLIWDCVQNVSIGDFERLVTYFLSTSRFSPMVPDFNKAIQELGIKPLTKTGLVTLPNYLKGNGLNGLDWEYPVKEGIWANSFYFFIRESGITHRFMVKRLCEDKELLELDKQAAAKWIPFWERITSPEYKGEHGSYSEHYQKAVKKYG